MYRMDHEGTLFRTPKLNSMYTEMDLTDFEDYARHNKLFNTSFDVSKRKALPEFGGNIGFGKNFDLAGNNLSVLASVGVSNGQQLMKDAYVRTLEATGNTLNNFAYDSYTNELKLASLASVGYSFRKQDLLSYTFFYARNASDTYMRREGVDYEDHNLIGSNSVSHIYSLQNHQLSGKHYIKDAWSINWSGSYSKTSSAEPDRRQVMFEVQDDNSLELFKLNRQETMRYFGSLDENEWVANLMSDYKFGDSNKIQAGVTYKDKQAARLQGHTLLLQSEQAEPDNHRHLQSERLHKPGEHRKRTAHHQSGESAERPVQGRQQHHCRIPPCRLLPDGSSADKPRSEIRILPPVG